MRPSPTMKDALSKTLIAVLFGANLAGFTLLGIMGLSENDPRKKEGPLSKKSIDEISTSDIFKIDWEQSRLEWIDIVTGIKIGGVPLFKRKAGTPTVEEYLRKKEELNSQQYTNDQNKP